MAKEKISNNGREGKDMQDMENIQTFAKEQTYNNLSLSSKKITEIAVRPNVKDGKIVFKRKEEDHRYIVEGE